MSNRFWKATSVASMAAILCFGAALATAPKVDAGDKTKDLINECNGIKKHAKECLKGDKLDRFCAKIDEAVAVLD